MSEPKTIHSESISIRVERTQPKPVRAARVSLSGKMTIRSEQSATEASATSPASERALSPQ